MVPGRYYVILGGPARTAGPGSGLLAQIPCSDGGAALHQVPKVRTNSTSCTKSPLYRYRELNVALTCLIPALGVHPARYMPRQVVPTTSRNYSRFHLFFLTFALTYD